MRFGLQLVKHKYVRLFAACLLVAVIFFISSDGRQDVYICQVPNLLDQSLYRSILANYSRYIIKAPHIKNTTKLVAFVLSHEGDVDTREQILKSWGSADESEAVSKGEAQIVFLLGNENRGVPTDPNGDNMLHVDIRENYKNLVLKELVAYLWIVDKFPSGLILKIDGKDTVASLDRLLKGIPPEEEIYCATFRGSQPERNPCHGWGVPYAHFPASYFPEYCTGPAYVMSTRVLRRILGVAHTKQALVVEDVFFTGVLAESAGVPRRDSQRIFSKHCRFSVLRSFGALLNGEIEAVKTHSIHYDSSGAKTTAVLIGHFCKNTSVPHLWNELK